MHKLRPREIEAMNLINLGHSRETVAHRMGISEGAVRSHLSRARSAGAAVRDDSAGQAMMHLSDEVLRWLAEITPAGCKVSDTIRGIIVDAYQEAQSPRKAASAAM